MTPEPPRFWYRCNVQPEWIDHNGHMNVAYYVLAFDWATDALYDDLGLGIRYVEATGSSTFALEAHVTYLREVTEGDPLWIGSRILGVASNRFHYFHEMYHADEGFLSATCEMISLHVDLSERRAMPLPERIRDNLETMMASQASLPPAPQVGRVMGLHAGRPNPPGGGDAAS